MQHRGLARQKSGTRSENLLSFLALAFSWVSCLNIYMRCSMATSYSFDDGFCCVLTRLKPTSDSGHRLQHSGSASRLQDPAGDILSGSIYPGVFQWLTLDPSSRDSLLLGKGSSISDCPKTSRTYSQTVAWSKGESR